MESIKKCSQMLAIVLLVSLQIQSSYGVQATDDAPTLQVTSDWLNDALKSYGGHGRDTQLGWIDENITFATISPSCTLTVQRKLLAAYDKRHPSVTFQTVPLGSVTEVIVDEWTSGDAGPFPAVTLSTGNLLAVMDRSNPRNRLSIELGNGPAGTADGRVADSPKEMAPRIQKALQHAVTLCRGTYTAPPQTKNPF